MQSVKFYSQSIAAQVMKSNYDLFENFQMLPAAL